MEATEAVGHLLQAQSLEVLEGLVLNYLSEEEMAVLLQSVITTTIITRQEDLLESMSTDRVPVQPQAPVKSVAVLQAESKSPEVEAQEVIQQDMSVEVPVEELNTHMFTQLEEEALVSDWVWEETELPVHTRTQVAVFQGQGQVILREDFLLQARVLLTDMQTDTLVEDQVADPLSRVEVEAQAQVILEDQGQPMFQAEVFLRPDILVEVELNQLVILLALKSPEEEEEEAQAQSQVILEDQVQAKFQAEVTLLVDQASK